ncbi:tyrosine-type recombinase/integrase [Nitrosopumilus sp.]|uniref:tyrosine-type recombinase/integrase n=1 Tax=Nitrosopumilus sp. TaxID=2024843 RepID=UPI003D100D2E
MVKQYYKVLKKFKKENDYGIKIRPQYASCLSMLKVGQRINQKDFATEFGHKFTKKNTQKAREEAVYHAFAVGKKIGVLRVMSVTELGYSMPYDEFVKLETVAYFMKQHRGSRLKNIDSKSHQGTRGTYAYRLWKFNNWIDGREAEFTKIFPSGKDTFKQKIQKVKLKGVEDLLHHYTQPLSQEREFVKIIKEYLLDSENADQSDKSMKVIANAIKSYFEKNDMSINFKYNAKAGHTTPEDREDSASLNLDELMQLFTVGNPTLVQKTALLCKFHRGLDTSTLIDRFNFEAWSQLAECFGTENYKKWDTKLCPVPVKLTRIKTTYPHTGFLDKDAIDSLVKYLDYRKKQTGKEMSEDQALFLTEKKKPITKEWVITTLKKLRKNAGLDEKLSGYMSTRYRINSHEFRDLLKSILMDSEVRPDVCEHLIGHKPRDSYEKQAELFSRTLRKEYSKASRRINIFSNFSSMAKGESNADVMNEKVRKLEENMAKMQKRIERTNSLRRKK